MYIRSIRLRDWKAYANAAFEFPVPTKNKNVVLIGAKNGYGKTSLLEAIILGLYGREGMNALARAVTNSDTEKSYDRFIERALHAQAFGAETALHVNRQVIGAAVLSIILSFRLLDLHRGGEGPEHDALHRRGA